MHIEYTYINIYIAWSPKISYTYDIYDEYILVNRTIRAITIFRQGEDAAEIISDLPTT